MRLGEAIERIEKPEAFGFFTGERWVVNKSGLEDDVLQAKIRHSYPTAKIELWWNDPSRRRGRRKAVDGSK